MSLFFERQLLPILEEVNVNLARASWVVNAGRWSGGERRFFIFISFFLLPVKVGRWARDMCHTVSHPDPPSLQRCL